MIPRIVHSCFLGDWPMTDLNKQCHQSWLTHLRGSAFVHWTPQNIPLTPWVTRALQVRPINAVSWLRYWCIYQFGGVALDNDIEILQPFDLDHGAFIGFQRDDTDYMCTNYSVLGAVPGHPFIKRLLDEMEKLDPGDSPLAGCCILTDRVLREFGMTGLNREQTIRDRVHVYPKEIFYPWFHTEPPDLSRVTPRTIAVHWWEGSWIEKNSTTAP